MLARATRLMAAEGVRWLDLLLPVHCLACQAAIERPPDAIFICSECREAMAREPLPLCVRCGAGLRTPGTNCPWCRAHRLRFDRVVALGRYRGELRGVVLRMKRAAAESLSLSMGRLLLAARGDLLRQWQADMVVPMPMHWRRRLQRGTNNPEVLASYLAKGLCVPLRPALRRVRNTRSQNDLNARQRFRNVRGAFELRSGYDLGGARVLLVDDVLTTGATASTAAGVLRRAGAAAVAVAVLARTEGPDSR